MEHSLVRLERQFAANGSFFTDSKHSRQLFSVHISKHAVIAGLGYLFSRLREMPHFLLTNRLQFVRTLEQPARFMHHAGGQMSADSGRTDLAAFQRNVGYDGGRKTQRIADELQKSRLAFALAPKMTSTEGEMPDAFQEGDKEVIMPLEKYGVKWMSIGYFAKPEQALIWRGPMACNALKQMILQVRWGELDFLLIDMPPGTGDIHISLVHDIPLEGAVIVSTPQDVALADVEKGVNMFRNESVNKPIFGLIENMAWFTPAEHPDEKYYIFGRDGGIRMAEKYGIPLLGQIPIVQSIREGGDSGEPAALSSRPDGLAFIEAAKQLTAKI